MQIIWAQPWHQQRLTLYYTHFKDTGFMPEGYDLIVTGDLGKVGKEICEEMLKAEAMTLVTGTMMRADGI
jgi:hypothetical protein